jgi:hypothetical protein
MWMIVTPMKPSIHIQHRFIKLYLHWALRFFTFIEDINAYESSLITHVSSMNCSQLYYWFFIHLHYIQRNCVIIYNF